MFVSQGLYLLFSVIKSNEWQLECWGLEEEAGGVLGIPSF